MGEMVDRQALVAATISANEIGNLLGENFDPFLPPASSCEVVEAADDDEGEIEIPDGAKPGPIDIEYKSKLNSNSAYDAAGYSNKNCGQRGTSNGIMGI